MSLLTTAPGSPLTAVAGGGTPTRPAVILPGLGNNTGDYRGLALTLRERYGIPAVVARVSRIDWLRYAAGLLDPNCWKGTLRPRPVLDWYLNRVNDAVAEAKQLFPQDEGGSISLIGHSAGGWIARVYMEEFRLSRISLLLTLGSPHLLPSKGLPGVIDQTRGLLDYVEKNYAPTIYTPQLKYICIAGRPPPKGVPGVVDQTRGILDYIEKNYAPAIYTPQLKYVCIAGRYIKGAHLDGNSNITSGVTSTIDKDYGMVESVSNVNNSKSISIAPNLWARFIGQSYKQVCGQEDVWGDGVVPEMSAHLKGALNMSLDGVYHSPVGSDDIIRPWYGSTYVLEKWVHHLLNL